MDPKVAEIIRLANEYALGLYDPRAFGGKSDVEITCLGLGQALSQAAHYSGRLIAVAAAEAFEDANFHDKAAELRTWAEEGD